MVKDRTAEFGWCLGVDVGGTKILGVVVDAVDGSIRHEVQLPTPQGSETVLAQIERVVSALNAECGDISLGALGVGLPGLVDDTGVLRYGPNLAGVTNFDIAEPLGNKFEVPVSIENDGACAAMAEHRFGAAKGFDHAVIITQGTGIGGGIIAAGQLLRGANGFAAEPGHMVIDPSGPLCACGRRGCWESLASGAGLVNLAHELIDEGRGTGLVKTRGGERANIADTNIRGEDISAALVQGDPDAVELFDRFADWVASGIVNFVNLLDPGVVVLGGGLTVVSEFFLARVEEKVEVSVVGSSHRPKVSIVAAQLGPAAGAVGSALNAYDASTG